jgi:hypothetical protein
VQRSLRVCSSRVFTSEPPLPRSTLAAISPVQPSVGWSLMEITSSPAAQHSTAQHSSAYHCTFAHIKHTNPSLVGNR